jgi:hypothetical protein
VLHHFDDGKLLPIIGGKDKETLLKWLRRADDECLELSSALWRFFMAPAVCAA